MIQLIGGIGDKKHRGFSKWDATFFGRLFLLAESKGRAARKQRPEHPGRILFTPPDPGSSASVLSTVLYRARFHTAFPGLRCYRETRSGHGISVRFHALARPALRYRQRHRRPAFRSTGRRNKDRK